MMFRTPEDAAIAAVISMLLEVSGNPKAGNVDREHNFPDLRYEHFLASSVSSYPVFLEATGKSWYGKNGAERNKKKAGIGYLIFKSIEVSSGWHKAQNVHFGAYILLIPLLRRWNSSSAFSAGFLASQELKKTTYMDSIYLLKGHQLSSARVMRADNLSLGSQETERFLRERKINLYLWMKMAPEENAIAKEVTEGYPLSIRNSRRIRNVFEKYEDINYATVLTYHTLLSEVPDALVISKYGKDVGFEVQNLARKILERSNNDPDADMKRFSELDRKLLERRINPGTIADLTISSLYLALLEGLRF
jgi:triphosphoribosyl-dephospho-CoA synthase